MSGDTEGTPVSRPRTLSRALVGPGPLRELKDLLYEMYLAADAPSLDEITGDVAADDALVGSPGRDTVRRCISGPGIPARQADVAAVATVLARRARWDAGIATNRVTKLWVEARLVVPPGRPLSEVTDPFALEVHRAIDTDLLAASAGLQDLPAYVERSHDDQLRRIAAEAVGGKSRMVILVGGSSTGKTRACWEILRHLPAGWRLWHPFDPTRPEAALADIGQLAPHTVVWLNEAQHYLLTNSDLGERVTAGLHTLLRDPGRAPVLVLATLWPEYWNVLTSPPAPGNEDTHSQARALLVGRDLQVPSAFTDCDLRVLADKAQRDPRLAYAENRAEHGEITQYLAGAPALVDRYATAGDGARALIEAAMDARRVGHGPGLPLALLEAAAEGYLNDRQLDFLEQDWLESALAYTSAPLRGTRGPLTRIRPRRGDSPSAQPLYRLADYLEQQSRIHRTVVRIPSALWNALADHAAPAHCLALARRAEKNHGLLEVALRLYTSAWDDGSIEAAWNAAEMLAADGQVDEALLWYERTVGPHHCLALFRGAELLADSGRLEEALHWYGRAAADGYPDALAVAVGLLSDEGKLDEALAWFERTVAIGDPQVWAMAVGQLERRGRLAEARAWHLRAADAGHVATMVELASHAARQGDTDEARNWYTRAAEVGHVDAAFRLGLLAQQNCDIDSARAWFTQGAEAGDPRAIAGLGQLCDDMETARSLYERAAQLGSERAMHDLGLLAQRDGDIEGARAWYERAARRGSAAAMLSLGLLARRQGNDETASTWFARAAGTGDLDAKFTLGVLTQRDGDIESARAWYTRAANAGHAEAAEALEELGRVPEAL